MKKIKVIFSDGSIGEVDEADLKDALSSGAKLFSESTAKAKSVTFADGSVGDVDETDLEDAISFGATLVKKKESGLASLFSNAAKTISQNVSGSGLSDRPLERKQTFEPKSVEEFNTEFEQLTGHKEFSLSEPVKPTGLLSQDIYTKQKKEFEEKKYLRNRDIQENEIDPVVDSVIKGTAKPQKLASLYSKPYGKKIVSNILNNTVPELASMAIEEDSFGNEKRWDTITKEINIKNRPAGVEAQNQQIFNLDNEIANTLNGLELTDILVSAGTGGGAANVSKLKLPQIDTNNATELGRIIPQIENAERITDKDGNEIDKADLLAKIDYKLRYLSSQKEMHPEIFSNSDKIKEAITRVNIGRERGESIPAENFAKDDENNQKHFELGLNFYKDARPGTYLNVIKGITKRGIIADTDFEEISKAGQQIYNQQQFREGAVNPDAIGKETAIKYDDTYQTKRYEYSLILSEEIKRLGYKNRAKVPQSAIDRAVALHPELTNREILQDIRNDEANGGTLNFGGVGITKGGGLTAFFRGVASPIKAINQTYNAIVQSPVDNYLDSKNLDLETLPSESGNIFNQVLEGFGQFTMQVLLARGVGKVIEAPIKIGTRAIQAAEIPVAEAIGITPRAILTPAQSNFIAAYPSTFITMTAQTYGSAYTDLLQKTGDPATARLGASVNTVVQSAVEAFIMPDVKIAEKAEGLLKTVTQKFTTDIIDLVKKGVSKDAAKTSIRGFVENTVKIMGGNLVEENLQQITDYVTESIFSPSTIKDRDLGNELWQTTKGVLVQMAIPTLLGAAGQTKQNKSFTKDALHTGAINFHEYKDALGKALIADEITPEQHNEAISILNLHRANINNAPKRDANGNVVSTDNQLEYAFQETVVRVNQEKAKTEKDEVQKEFYESKAKQADEEKRKIFYQEEVRPAATSLTPEQEVIKKALEGKEITGIYKGIAEDAVKTPEDSKQFLDDASSQINNKVKSEVGNSSETAIRIFGKTIADHASKKEPIQERELDMGDKKTESEQPTEETSKELVVTQDREGLGVSSKTDVNGWVILRGGKKNEHGLYLIESPDGKYTAYTKDPRIHVTLKVKGKASPPQVASVQDKVEQKAHKQMIDEFGEPWVTKFALSTDPQRIELIKELGNDGKKTFWEINDNIEAVEGLKNNDTVPTPQVTSLNEKEINPKDRPTLRIGDLEGMDEGSKKFKIITTKDGETITLKKNKYGEIYAVNSEKEVVGFATKLSYTETDLSVVTEYQQKGIGTELLVEFKKLNPEHETGGLTPLGKKTLEAANRKINPPESKQTTNEDNTQEQVKPSIKDMNSEQLYEHAKNVKDFLKKQEVEFFGEEGAKKYREARSISYSGSASDPRVKEADRVMKEMEESLTKEQQDSFFGVDQPEGIYDPAEIRDIATRVRLVEESESVTDLGGALKLPLLEFNRNPNNEGTLAVLNAAKKKAEELKFDPKEVFAAATKRISNDIPDKNDQADLAASILKKLAKPSDPKVLTTKNKTEPTKEAKSVKRDMSRLNEAKKVYKDIGEVDEPVDARGAALEYFARGGKLNEADLNQEVTGSVKRASLNTGAKEKKTSEAKARDYISKDAPTIDQIAHSIWETLPGELRDAVTTQDIRNELIDVANSHNTRLSAAMEFRDRYIQKQFKEGLSEAEAAEMDEGYIQSLQKLVDELPENQQSELIELLGKYQNEYGIVDWGKLEKDSAGFNGDILSLPIETQNALDGIIQKNIKSGQGKLDVAYPQDVKKEKTSSQEVDETNVNANTKNKQVEQQETEEIKPTELVTEATPPTGGDKEPPTKKPATKSGDEGGKLNDKGILGHLYKAKNIPEAARQGFADEGLKYETKSQQEAEDVAKAIIDEMGIDDAVLAAEAMKFDGDVNSLIFAESLNRLKEQEDAADTPEGKLEAAMKFAEVGITYDKMARYGGRFNAAIAHFYKKSPLGIIMMENANRKKGFDEWSKPKDTSWKEFFTEMMKEPEFEAIVNEQIKEGMKKERAEARKSRIKKVDDFFEKAKEQFRDGALYSTIIPPKLIRVAIDGMQKAYHAGEKIAELIEKAVDYISEGLGGATWNKDKFRKEWEEKLKDSIDAVEAYKTRLRNQISELDEQIKSKARKTKDKNEKEYDDETKALIKERDEKKKLLDEVVPTKKPLTDEEVRSKILEKFRNKLKGLSDRQKEEVVRKSFKKIIENGGLDYEDFRKIIAEVTGRGELTDAEAIKLKELVKQMNVVDDAAKKVLQERTPEALKRFRDAEFEAGKATKEFNEIIYNKPDIVKRLTSIMQLSTLGIPSLINNPIYNVWNQISVRLPVGIVNDLLDRSIGGIAKLIGKRYEKEWNVFETQAEFFNKLGFGSRESVTQLLTGLNKQDYLQKEVYGQSIRPASSIRDLWAYAHKKKELTKAQVIDKAIQATVGIPAEIVARVLNLGDKPQRFAAEGAQASAFAKNLGLKGMDYRLFIEFPREEAYRIYREKGFSEAEAGKKADYVKDVIIKEGQRSTFQQDNFLNDKLSLVFGKGDSGVGNLVKSLTISPYIKIPSNAYWSYYNLVNPEVAMLQALWYGGKAAKRSINPDVKLLFDNPSKNQSAKMDLREARYWLGHAVAGIAMRAVVIALVKAAVFVPANSGDEAKKEREGESFFEQQGTINWTKLMTLLRGGDPTKVKGGLVISNRWFGQFGTIGNAIARKYEDATEEQREAQNDFWNIAFGGLEVSALKDLQQGVFSNSSAILSSLDGSGYGGKRYLLNVINMMSNIVQPAAIAQINRAAIPVVTSNKADTFLGELKNSFAQRSWLFRNLSGVYPPSKINIWGDPIEKGGSMFMRLFGISMTNPDAFAEPIYQDYKKTGDTGFFPPAIPPILNEKQLNTEQYNKLSAYIGAARKDYVAPYINGEAQIDGWGAAYENIEDLEVRKKVLIYLYDLGRFRGVEKFLEDYPEFAKEEKTDYQKEVADKFNEFKKSVEK